MRCRCPRKFLRILPSIREPENHTLAEIDELMRYFRETPVEDVNYFRQTMRLGRLLKACATALLMCGCGSGGGGSPSATPKRWSDLDVSDYDGLILAGGHAPKMRQYLGSAELADQVARFWALDRPVGAICHGVLVLARARAADGRSVLADARTTCLPKYMERSAFFATAWRRGRYYRTYPAYVEDEVRAALVDPERQFKRGPRELRRRGTATDDSAAFVVEDGRYVSARWPGDAYLFAKRLTGLMGP